jgi:hypothetical protein
MQCRTLGRKAAEDDSVDDGRRGQRVDYRGHGDLGGAIGGEIIYAGGDGGKGNRRKIVGLAELQRSAIARRQRFILALAAAMPDRPYGMNDMPRRQLVAFGDFGVAGRAAMQRTAFGKQFRSGGAMDRAVDAAAAPKRIIRGVDDRINA